MKKKKEVVAMLLAGGQGKRLMVLTETVAKPAVPFGGKYRIIDFSLSNCTNSGIDTVGILTQYQPLVLNDYIGNGRPWGLSSNFGGAHTLPPYEKNAGSEWYKGTANAIYQNMHFIDMYEPEYVLCLSGDHIYKMDYSLMIDAHKKKEADCTIAVLNVSLDEASRFGIMNTNPDGSIYEFEEKPEKPKSTQASMGVYVFTWKVLREYLINDEKDPESSNDFGKNIIPNLLNDGKKLFAYEFGGYWKDVGTIESLWEANMDLIDPKSEINIRDNTFKIYARNSAEAPSFLGKTGSIHNSTVSGGCEIYGKITNSIISSMCIVEEGAVVDHCVIMPNTIIRKDAVLEYSIVGENSDIGAGSHIGQNPIQCVTSKWGISVVGHEVKVEPNTVLKATEML